MLWRVSILLGITWASAAGAGTNPTLVSSCAVGPYAGRSVLPLVTQPFTLAEASFDLTGVGCSGTSGVLDAVLCFTPENSCTLTIACDQAAPTFPGDGQYLDLFLGPCVDAPESCLAWDFDASHTELAGVEVSSGQRYCFVCQDLAPGRVLAASLTASAGDCGWIDIVVFEDGFESAGTGAWGPCVPAAETCGDGIDQNCDGVDEICLLNDGPGGATDISAGGTVAIDIGTAHNDQDFKGTGCGSTGGRDAFFTFTLPAPEVVYLDTFGSNFDTDLRLFAGSCTAMGALQGCFDDQCSILQSQGALQLAAGSYCLVADQYSSAQVEGDLVLRFTRGGRTGSPLPASPVPGNSCSGASASMAGCQPDSPAQDIAYYFTACPSQTRTLSANVCTGTGFDSVLYLRRAGSAGDIACNDDTAGCGNGFQSSIVAPGVVGPGLLWLTVDGYQANCGQFTLTYTLN